MLNILKRTGMSALQLRVIALCTCVNMLDGFDILAMAYTAPAVGKLWALSPSRLGVLFSLGLTGMMAGSIFLAPLADRFGRRPMILSCLLVATLSMFAAANSGDLLSLGCARVATGLAIGAILPCMNTMVAEYASPRSPRYGRSGNAGRFCNWRIAGRISGNLAARPFWLDSSIPCWCDHDLPACACRLSGHA